MKYIARGSGRPLLLVHGLGGSWRSWSPILDALAAEREVVAVDLPGFGSTPPLPGRCTVASLTDALTRFLKGNGLMGVDVVGTSMGARLVLELARRGAVGAAVSLDPGGFWRGWERYAFHTSIAVMIRLVRALQPVMPFVTRHAATRALMFAQLSSHPGRLSPQVALDEMRAYAASSAFDELLHELTFGEPQEGAPRGSIAHPLVIGWGFLDRLCFPRQARRALALFPDAELHWFDQAGHFPHWDAPEQTIRLILESTDWRLRRRRAQRLGDAANLAGRAAKPAGDLGVGRGVDSRR